MARSVAERADVVPVLAELLRARGYEGMSLSDVEQATGLGRGSLYHFFPGGKKEMVAVVLTHIDDWFEREVFEPLRGAGDARAGIGAMFDAVDRYFRSGRRVCLIGALALGDSRDPFSEVIASYFERWATALAQAIRRSRPRGPGAAASRAEALDALAAIQGGLTLARALDDPAAFGTAVERARERLIGPIRAKPIRAKPVRAKPVRAKRRHRA